MRIKINLSGKCIWNRTQFSTRIKYGFSTRPICSSTHNSSSKSKNDSNKPTTIDDDGSSSLSSYDEQYKALQNLDFMTAAKIVFTGPPKKKKFGLDFHLVQLFFVCLPSLAVYLVAQYARSEMRKMDAELELRKQAEFEAQAKEMERKAAEERAAAESSPAILEVKERLNKLEETVKEIASKSKEQLSDPTRTDREDHKDQEQQASTIKPSNDIGNEPVANISNEKTNVSSQEKSNSVAAESRDFSKNA